MSPIQLALSRCSGNAVIKINQFCARRIWGKAESDSLTPEQDDSTIQTAQVPSKIDKSRLKPQHKKMLHNIMPYSEPASWSHLTEKYQRKVFCRYGSQSNINPRICFNSKVDSKDVVGPTQKELDPMIINMQMMHANKKQKIAKREKEISEKLSKLEQWKYELTSKIAKKEAEAITIKERKARLVEEVRSHFGFKVDHRDEKFKQMLEQRELADKKKHKEAKRKEKTEKMMAKLIGKTN